LHLAAARGELDRVRQQIPDDLLQTIRVSGHRRGQWLDHRFDPHASGVSRRHDGRHRIAQDRRQIDRLDVQAEATRDDP
jgi:hypothetical protein